MTRHMLLVVALAVLPASAGAGQKKDEAPTQVPGGSDNYDVLIARYLAAARLTSSAPAREAGAWMNTLTGDLRAQRVNDLVTVRVEEVISGKGAADSNLTKESSAAAGVGQFFGVETLVPGSVDVANLVTLGTGSDFKGTGATARAGTLSATLTARVAEVLPNGDLVIEGVREIEINGDRQIVVLTGVARVVDIRPGNVLPSSAIGQLRIRYFGKGLIKDSLTPGWLIRILNKIF
jgi:flagellar L-ring protein FlgH